MVKRATPVEIPLDYLITTHVLLNAAYEKLKEALGEEAALTFFSLSSDSVPWEGMEEKPTLESLEATMKDYGYSLENTERGDRLRFRLYCPHASKIHPNLQPEASFCPMSQVVLGAVRKQYPFSTLVKGNLNTDGSSFEIQVKDKR